MDVLPYFIQGDCIDKLKKLNCMGKQYKVINMDESLDMMLDLKTVLNLCNTMLCDDGVLIIKVANNYSVLQRHLLNNKMIDNEFWLDEEGHPYYFNKNGLNNYTILHFNHLFLKTPIISLPNPISPSVLNTSRVLSSEIEFINNSKSILDK